MQDEDLPNEIQEQNAEAATDYDLIRVDGGKTESGINIKPIRDETGSLNDSQLVSMGLVRRKSAAAKDSDPDDTYLAGSFYGGKFHPYRESDGYSESKGGDKKRASRK